MPLFIGDYLKDTTNLQAEQHGAYLLLLMAAWCRGGALPDDDEELAAIARVPLERWQSHTSAKVLPFFRHSDGCYLHDRLLDELERARTNVAQKSRAGAAGAAARWQNDGTRIAGAKRAQRQTDTPAPAPAPSPSPSTDVEGDRPRKRASRRAPADFDVTDDMREWASESAPFVNLEAATAKFRDHTFKTAMTDWPATWRNWIRKDQEYLEQRRVGPGPTKSFAQQDAEERQHRADILTGRARASSDSGNVIDITPGPSQVALIGGES